MGSSVIIINSVRGCRSKLSIPSLGKRLNSRFVMDTTNTTTTTFSQGQCKQSPGSVPQMITTTTTTNRNHRFFSSCKDNNGGNDDTSSINSNSVVVDVVDDIQKLHPRKEEEENLNSIDLTKNLQELFTDYNVLAIP